MPNSIIISWVYIPCVCIRVSNSFSVVANSLMSSMYIRWLIFSCDLLNLYLPVYFLCIWLRGIITITNSNGDSASHWNLPLWIFNSANIFPLVVNSTRHVKVHDFCWYRVHFEVVYYLVLSDYIISFFCCQSTPKPDFSIWTCSHWRCVD